MESPQLMATGDADWALALAYALAREKPALEAVREFDVMLSQTACAPRNPDLSRLRLAWWRDAVAQLPLGQASHDPLLLRLQSSVQTPHQARCLSDLAEAWMQLVPDGMTSDEARYEAIKQRGRAFYGFFSTGLDRAGEVWSLRDFGAVPLSVDIITRIARSANTPLTILAELARRDLVRAVKGQGPLPVLRRMLCAARIALGARIRK